MDPKVDLYAIDLTGVSFVRPCGGNTGDKSDDDTESCMEWTLIPGVRGAVAIRDSKAPERGDLRFDHDELYAFVQEWRVR